MPVSGLRQPPCARAAWTVDLKVDEPRSCLAPRLQWWTKSDLAKAEAPGGECNPSPILTSQNLQRPDRDDAIVVRFCWPFLTPPVGILGEALRPFDRLRVAPSRVEGRLAAFAARSLRQAQGAPSRVEGLRANPGEPSGFDDDV
jgi:hypothetical protein